MLELPRDGTFRESLYGTAATALLSVWTRGSNGAHVPQLLGKRIEESRERGPPTLNPPNPANMLSRSAVEKAFVYSALRPEDTPALRYISVSVANRKVEALLDTGSSRTYVGPDLVNYIKNTGFSFRATADRRVTTATGQNARVRGEKTMPLSVKGKTREITVFSLPTLALSCIIGIDFLKAFEIVPDVAREHWYFSGDSSNTFPFGTEASDSLASTLVAPEEEPATRGTEEVLSEGG
jgi:hypothetical protein